VTGLYNRKYFLERLDEEISRAYRDNHKLALLILNVELPAELDTCVRMVRLDDYLYGLSHVMREHVRKMDVIARIGETQFAFIMPHTAGHAKTVADRLQELVASREIDSGRRSQKLRSTAQVGVSRYPADAFTSRDMMLKASEDLGLSIDEVDTGHTRLKKAA
jgi:diguanylate cyclase (GGDEF)-like protein